MNIRERSREVGKALNRYITGRIASGQLQPGDKLPTERDLAEMFGGGRGAIRRTLLELETDGLIGREVGRGTFVKAGAAARSAPLSSSAALDPSTLTSFEQVARVASPSDAFELRLALEPAMLEQVAWRASASDFDTMTHCLEQGRLSKTVEELEHWDNLLHQSMAAATRNPMFVAAYAIVSAVRVGGEWGEMRRRAFTEDSQRKSYEDHHAVIQALRNRDAATARKVLSSHLERWRKISIGAA